MDLNFIKNHRSTPRAFSRTRKLPFIDVCMLILRNSIKSLQLMLNEFVLHTKKHYSVTASAFTQARHKLKHTTFIELNDAIVSLYYRERQIKKHMGFRILAFDGCKLTLPNNDEIKSEFGSKPIGNHTEKKLGEYCVATFEACYDVLNHIAVKTVLSRGTSYEVDLVNEMFAEVSASDLLIYDRGLCFI